MNVKLDEILTMIRIIGSEQHILAVNINRRLQEIEERLTRIEEKLQEFEVESAAASSESDSQQQAPETHQLIVEDASTVSISDITDYADS
jgi:hypothetical protein